MPLCCYRKDFAQRGGPAQNEVSPKKTFHQKWSFFRVKNYSKLVDRVCHGFRKVSNKVGDGKAFMH